MDSSLHVSISRRSALLLVGASTYRLRAQTGSITRIDLFPAFLRVCQETNVLSSETRANRFLQLVVTPNLDLYDAFTGTVSLERATRYVERVQPLVPVIEDLHNWVGADFDAKLARFQKELPDFQWEGSVVFMPNLFGFDAGGGPVHGKDVLVFGLDTIAKMDGPQADLSALISHELFHIYHSSFHPEWKGHNRGNDIPLYRLVWGEGLATYASQQLNPKAAQTAVFRSATLVSSCQEHIQSLAGSLLENLDSTQKTPFMEWMSTQARSSEVPPRAGYYFGWRVAAVLGRNRSLRDLARLSDSEVRGAMVRELHTLQRTE